MSTNSRKNDDQEVDLTAVSRSIKNFFAGLNTFYYNCIRFVQRNIILLIVLFVLGVAVGACLDYVQKKVYTHEIIVSPNFGSTDYLYSKIDMLESKIKDRDTVFLKSMGIATPKDLLDIEVTPIVDIFKLVNSNGSDQNYKLLELMAQDGDIKKISVDKATSKNYPFHLVELTTVGVTTPENTINPILDFLNDNSYYKSIQKQNLENIQIKLRVNDSMIAQIDKLLETFSTDSGSRSQSVYINENTQINDILKTKDQLVSEQGRFRIDLVGMDKIIKDNSVIANIKDKSMITGKMKLILPFLFVFVFLCVYFFRAFYKKQSLRHNTK